MPTDVARALGDLEGTVRSLQAQWERQENAAVAGRKALYEKFEAMTTQVQRIDGRVEDVQQDVAEIKKDMDEKVMPAIDAYALDNARRAGWLDSGKLLWAGIIGACTLIGFVIHELLQYFAKVGGLPRLPIP